jgi:hypothetical protein
MPGLRNIRQTFAWSAHLTCKMHAYHSGIQCICEQWWRNYNDRDAREDLTLSKIWTRYSRRLPWTRKLCLVDFGITPTQTDDPQTAHGLVGLWPVIIRLHPPAVPLSAPDQRMRCLVSAYQRRRKHLCVEILRRLRSAFGCLLKFYSEDNICDEFKDWAQFNTSFQKK